jgi:hypothetical protein
MKNQKFNEAIDEIVGFIVDVNKLQMDQLKCNIKAVHEANTHEVDPHAIAKMILDSDKEKESLIIGTIPPDHPSVTLAVPPQPAIHLRDEMVCTAEKKTPYGKAGDLDTLSYVKVGNGAPHGKEFYHHCPMHNNDLIRLHYVKQDDVHACPVCKLVFW